MHIVSILVDELKYDSEKSLTDLVLSESTFVAILEIAFNVIRNSIRFPISLSGKVCECILTRPEVIQYSDSVREMIRSLIQSTAMDKKTDQEVRDILYGSIDQIDAIPAIVRVEKKRKSLDKQGTTKKTKKM